MVDVLAVAEKVTEPLPDPLAPCGIVIQLVSLRAVHPHPLGALTLLVPVPPAAWNEVGVVSTVYPHGVVPVCVTVTVCAPTVMAPLRVLEVELAVTEKSSEPVPDPPAFDASTIHETLVLACQLHPAPVVIVSDPVPPPAPKECEAGAAAYVQATENMNELEGWLMVLPPGPTALTRDSNTIPVGIALTEASGTRINPSPPGAGLLSPWV